MAFGRLFRVRTRRGDPHAVMYVVAEPDAEKALELLKQNGVTFNGEIEDLGRVTSTLLKALSLQPGQISPF